MAERQRAVSAPPAWPQALDQHEVGAEGPDTGGVPCCEAVAESAPHDPEELLRLERAREAVVDELLVDSGLYSEGGSLLSMKLEAVIEVYSSNNPSEYEDLQQAWQVDWTAEMGQGTYGKVYLGTKDDQRGCAIKMLRDEAVGRADAKGAAEAEVTRHVALGAHPNVVRLLDVGLFRRSQAVTLAKGEADAQKTRWTRSTPSTHISRRWTRGYQEVADSAAAVPGEKWLI